MAIGMDNDVLARAGRRLERFGRRSLKDLRQRADRSDGARSLVMIVGCQRSGTTMMSRVFDADPNSRIFDEISKLSSNDAVEGLRLNDLANVKAQMLSGASRLVVSKPLVESHRVPALLDALPDSYAIWMYRHYKDVVNSNLKRWGDQNGFDDIRPIIDGDIQNWRAVDLADEVVELIRSKSAGDLLPADAAALFWYSRNTHFFRQNLAVEPRVLLYRYEDVVTEPTTSYRAMYDFFQQTYPGDEMVDQVLQSSVGKGSSVELSPDIQELCDDMLHRLDQVFEAAK